MEKVNIRARAVKRPLGYQGIVTTIEYSGQELPTFRRNMYCGAYRLTKQDAIKDAKLLIADIKAENSGVNFITA